MTDIDLTLGDIVNICDEIHSKIESVNPSSFYVNEIEIRKDINILTKMFSQIKTIHAKVSNIHSICTNKCKTINRRYNKGKPKETHWLELNQKLLVNKPLAHDIMTKVRTVNSINEIPNIPLYWVENIGQYATQINGIVFRGNIGNIYNKSDIRERRITNQTVICAYGNECKNILSEKECAFYHDQLDLLELRDAGKISAEFFRHCKKKHRNFFNTSWIYTDMPHNKKNSMMRHFGSRNVLKHELDIMNLNNSRCTKTSLDNYRQQVMHDLLVMVGASKSIIEVS